MKSKVINLVLVTQIDQYKLRLVFVDGEVQEVDFQTVAWLQIWSGHVPWRKKRKTQGFRSPWACRRASFKRRGEVEKAVLRTRCEGAKMFQLNKSEKHQVVTNYGYPENEETARGALWYMDLNSRIQQMLTLHGGIRLAILFGSLAKGRATPESDLDLAVLMDAPISSETKMALIDVLSQAIGRPVDLIDLRVAGEPLLGQILKHGVRLLGSDSDYAELLKRHLFEEADFMPYRRRILAERRQAWIGK